MEKVIILTIIQNEIHIFYQNTELQEYVDKYGIITESWYPFGGREHTSEIFQNGVILTSANKYRKSLAQIILRWQVQTGYIVMPGSSDEEHIKENYDIFDIELTTDEMLQINGLKQNKRYGNW